MGKIKYSIVPRTINLAEQALAKKNNEEFTPIVKFYASAQQAETLTMEKFAQHISDHHSKYGKGDIYCVLTEMVYCMREQLLLGNKICLGDLGSFYITLSSKGADYYDEFNPASNVVAINVRWEIGDEFKTLLDDAKFELVETRKAAAATLKQVRESYPSRPEDETADGDSADDSADTSADTSAAGGESGGESGSESAGGETTPSGNTTPSGDESNNDDDDTTSGGNTSGDLGD